MRRLLVLAALLVALPASAVTIDWVSIGNPGNASDTARNCWAANCGSVPYRYRISKYEVTNAQYSEFLNAVDPEGLNVLGLYNAKMGADTSHGGIDFVTSNASGSKYVVKLAGGYGDTGFANKPVNYVSFYDVLRFSNWLNNGQGTANTEDGAYTLLGGTATPSNVSVTRNPGAITFLPSENEWYKAAYFDQTYWDYPTGTNTATICSTPTATANHANCNFAVGGPVDVGSYTGSAGPHGTFDQGGNVWEWNEELISAIDTSRGFRGGSWSTGASTLAASFRSGVNATVEHELIGFRVASLVPEPGTGLLVMTGLLGLAARRKRRSPERPPQHAHRRLRSWATPGAQRPQREGNRQSGGVSRGGNRGRIKMKKVFGLWLGTALTLGAAAFPAGATRFEGTLGFSIGTFGTPPFTGTSSGMSTPNHVTIPGGNFGGMGTVSITGPLPNGTIIAPITGLVVSIASNGPADFTGNPLSGQMPLAGTALVKGNLGGGPVTLAVVPLFTNHTPSSGAGSVGLGIGGSVLLTIGGDPNYYLKVFNTNWAGMKTVTGLPYTYDYHIPFGFMASQIAHFMYSNGTAMYTGTDDRTPGGLGQVTLVSPTKIVLPPTLTPPFPSRQRIFVALGTLTLKFVPEPGTLLLLGLGVAVLGALGRQRMHRE